MTYLGFIGKLGDLSVCFFREEKVLCVSEYNVNLRYEYLPIFPMKSFEYIKPLDMRIKWSTAYIFYMFIYLLMYFKITYYIKY